LRTLCEPCETGPRWKLWRLIVPWKPLPDRDAAHLDLVAGRERLDGDVFADDGLTGAAELDERAVRSDAVLREVADLRLRELPFRHRVERELDGLVAVMSGVFTSTTGHGPASITVTGVTNACLRVEDLGHPQFPTEDAFH